MKRAPPATAKSRRPGAVPSAARRVRIQDVAQHAMVSIGTVSAVLNHNGRVSDATRDRVRETMLLLGYRPDLYASNLARRQSTLLGLLVSNLQNPFFAETAQAIEDEAARFGYRVSLAATGFSPDRQRAAVREFLRARIAGLAVVTSEYDDAAYRDVLASRVPAVFLDGGKPAATITALRVDAESGMRLAVEHLIQLGHRDLLYLRSSQQARGPQLISHKLREQGFRAAVRSSRNHHLRTRVVDLRSPGGNLDGLDLSAAFAKVDFTAVVACTDVVAMMACHQLRLQGLEIPGQISVVGFDNIQFSRFFCPPLSTVDISRRDLARITISALLGRGNGSAVSLPTHLVTRASTALREQPGK